MSDEKELKARFKSYLEGVSPDANTSAVVVAFPSKGKTIVHPFTQKQHDERMEQWKREFLDAITERQIQLLFRQLELEGLKLHNQQFMADFTLVREAVRAALYRTEGVKHDLHELATVQDANEVRAFEVVQAANDNEPPDIVA